MLLHHAKAPTETHPHFLANPNLSNRVPSNCFQSAFQQPQNLFFAARYALPVTEIYTWINKRSYISTMTIFFDIGSFIIAFNSFELVDSLLLVIIYVIEYVIIKITILSCILYISTSKWVHTCSGYCGSSLKNYLLITTLLWVFFSFFCHSLETDIKIQETNLSLETCCKQVLLNQ